MHASPVLDIKPLEELTGGDPETIKELLDIYVEDVEERLQEFIELQGTDDEKSILRQIHTIKGSSATIGARRMQTSASRIEKILRAEGEKEDISLQIKDLQEEFKCIKEHIQVMLRQT